MIADELISAAQSLLAVTCFADNGYCSVCHGYWPSEHREWCQGKRMMDAIDADSIERDKPIDAECMLRHGFVKDSDQSGVWFHSTVGYVAEYGKEWWWQGVEMHTQGQLRCLMSLKGGA